MLQLSDCLDDLLAPNLFQKKVKLLQGITTAIQSIDG
jgi:hypothetical protein